MDNKPYHIKMIWNDPIWSAFGFIHGGHCISAYGRDPLDILKECKDTMASLVGDYSVLLPNLTITYPPEFPHD